jgi:hypothetical protein
VRREAEEDWDFHHCPSLGNGARRIECGNCGFLDPVAGDVECVVASSHIVGRVERSLPKKGERLPFFNSQGGDGRSRVITVADAG